MLDVMLFQALEPPLPPELPKLAVERVWLSSVADRTKRYSDRIVRDSEERVAAWRRRLDEIKSITVASAPKTMLTESERVQFDQLIFDFEFEAESRAKQIARMEKRAGRDIKRQFETDPSLASVTREFSRRLSEIEREVIEHILDYALFLRAFRSERIVESRGGPRFDDPAELERYLDVELARKRRLRSRRAS